MQTHTLMAVDTMEHQAPSPVKWLMIVGLFISCFSGSTTPELRFYNEADIRLLNAGGIYKVNDQPFSGIVFRLAANRIDTLAVASFINGLEDGEWRSYYSNAQLNERRHFSRGKKVGRFEGWWSNGRQRLLYHFANDEYEGNCKDWSDRGVMVSNMNYKRGYEDGLQQQFYENGKVKANYMMIDGRRYGLLGTKNCVNVSDSIFKK